jgi:hypothetical protein
VKQLLIITGPQGSGNHLWSKVFAESPSVYGWRGLRDTYWIPHDKEPFAEAWNNTNKLASIEFDQSYAVTSISCPYAYHGTTVEPNYEKFINQAEELGYHVKVAIIGRDQNVLQYQQERVRGVHSFKRFRNHLPYLIGRGAFFLSTELLYLYRNAYLKSVERNLGFPIYIGEEKLEEILIQDPNAKYFHPAGPQDLDKYVRHVSGLI